MSYVQDENDYCRDTEWVSPQRGDELSPDKVRDGVTEPTPGTERQPEKI